MNRILDYIWVAVMLAIVTLPSGAAEQQQRPFVPKKMAASRLKVFRSLGNSASMTTPLRLDIDLRPLNKTPAEPQDERDLAYSVEITNSSKMAVCVDVWAEVELPNGKLLDPILLKKNLRLPAGLIAKQEIEYPLPKCLPEGAYTIRLQMGTFPNAVLARDKLTFEVQPGQIRDLKLGGSNPKRESCNSCPTFLH